MDGEQKIGKDLSQTSTLLVFLDLFLCNQHNHDPPELDRPHNWTLSLCELHTAMLVANKANLFGGLHLEFVPQNHHSGRLFSLGPLAQPMGPPLVCDWKGKIPSDSPDNSGKEVLLPLQTNTQESSFVARIWKQSVKLDTPCIETLGWFSAEDVKSNTCENTNHDEAALTLGRSWRWIQSMRLTDSGNPRVFTCKLCRFGFTNCIHTLQSETTDIR